MKNESIFGVLKIEANRSLLYHIYKWLRSSTG